MKKMKEYREYSNSGRFIGCYINAADPRNAAVAAAVNEASVVDENGHEYYWDGTAVIEAAKWPGYTCHHARTLYPDGTQSEWAECNW